MRKYTCYLEIGTHSIRHELWARDYFDARALIEAQFPGVLCRWLTEA